MDGRTASGPAMSQIVGRDAAQRLLARLWQGEDPGVSAIVLTGDAGIGKTALWEWAVAQAAGRDVVVLTSRAGQAEARLPWVVITDLMSVVPKQVLDGLPEPQREALQVVMLQASAGEVPDDRAVGTAVWQVLTALAADSLVLLAIDDLPYVDTASAAALRFALRRVATDHRIRVVATVRGDDSGLPPIDAFATERVDAVPVGPLSVGGVAEVLGTRLGVRLARPVLLRVHSTSGGNPLYALELARALQRIEFVPAPGVPLPIPNGLAALVADRVGRLPASVLDIAAATAAAWRLTTEDLPADALMQAVDAGLVVLDGPVDDAGQRVVRAVHPLLSAAAYAALSVSARRALHERLAARTADPVEYARHTALAGVRPSAEIGAALDAGVGAALAAGTPDIAVDLSRLALEHSTDDATRADRLDRMADAMLRTGDTEGANATQREAVALTPAGLLRAQRRVRLAEFLVEARGWLVAAAELEASLADAGTDPETVAQVLLTLAAVSTDITAMESLAQRAMTLLDGLEDPDPFVLSMALTQLAGSRFRAGRGLDHDMCRRAIEIEQQHAPRRLSDRADAGYAALLKYTDELDDAETRLTGLLAEARASGDLSAIAYCLAHLPQISLWRGDLDGAQQFAEEHMVIADEGGLMFQMAQAAYNMGIVMAWRGRLDEAESLLSKTISGGAPTAWDQQRANGGLGLVKLIRADFGAAVGHLDRWHELLSEMHFGEPGYSRSYLDYLEALVGSGRLPDAHRFLAELQRQVDSSGRRSAAAVALTGQALIDAAEGRLDDARAAMMSALAWYDTSPFRLDRARARLIAGRIHRRAKAKLLARDLLGTALAEFDAMGALGWAEQTRAEMARLNIRPPAPSWLTETERRVAELAAAGLTNREVAQRLFVSTKTVEANLARVYRKLSITSRAELGFRMGTARPQ
jgi:DNA-binding NarL/FixJ family response regulator